MDLSIIIVSYNTREMTLACLHSVYEQTRGLEFEVVVVENASVDGSGDAIAREFPQVRLVRLEENVGFAGGNNVGARHARGGHLLLLNPDTVVLDGAIQKLHAFARAHPGAGVWGGRTLKPDGSLDPDCCLGRPTPWSVFCQASGLALAFKGHRLLDPESLGSWKRDSVREVDVICGCFMLIDAEVWRRLEGFDPRFFMYCEEADLCVRGRALGYRPLFCPEASIIHYGAASQKVRADKVVRMLRARAEFFRKHWRPGMARFAIAMMEIRALNRLIACRLRARLGRADSGATETWRSVWAQRRQWAVPPTPAGPEARPA